MLPVDVSLGPTKIIGCFLKVRSGPAPALTSVMFCPLCQAEYRDSFSQCSDCKLELVETSGEAQSAALQLWKGTRQRTLDLILDTLSAHEIPTHWKEVANDDLQVRFLGSRLRPSIELHYEVWVLRSDSARARNAIEAVK